MRWTIDQVRPGDDFRCAFAILPTPMTVPEHCGEWLWFESYEWRLQELPNGRIKLLRRPLGSKANFTGIAKGGSPRARPRSPIPSSANE